MENTTTGTNLQLNSMTILPGRLSIRFDEGVELVDLRERLEEAEPIPPPRD